MPASAGARYAQRRSTRILGQEQTTHTGGFYSAQEFDLAALDSARGRFMEIGRTCVHPDYRSGAAIAVLWSGVADFITDGGYRHLIGCASIGLESGFGAAHAIFRQLNEQHSSPESLRVRPRLPLPGVDTHSEKPRLPPLLKAYISLGAKVGGPPCWDPAFRVADLSMHLQIENLGRVNNYRDAAPSAIFSQDKTSRAQCSPST